MTEIVGRERTQHEPVRGAQVRDLLIICFIRERQQHVHTCFQRGEGNASSEKFGQPVDELLLPVAIKGCASAGRAKQAGPVAGTPRGPFVQ